MSRFFSSAFSALAVLSLGLGSDYPSLENLGSVSSSISNRKAFLSRNGKRSLSLKSRSNRRKAKRLSHV